MNDDLPGSFCDRVGGRLWEGDLAVAKEDRGLISSQDNLPQSRSNGGQSDGGVQRMRLWFGLVG